MPFGLRKAKRVNDSANIEQQNNKTKTKTKMATIWRFRINVVNPQDAEKMKEYVRVWERLL